MSLEATDSWAPKASIRSKTSARETHPTIEPTFARESELFSVSLDRYHFTQYGYEDSNYYRDTFFPNAEDIRYRTHSPSNPQLKRLKNASELAKTDELATCDSSAQLFGEYLHAFEDTFAHRNQENVPYTAETFGWGKGHLFGGENPDYTYNHIELRPAGFGRWDVNEDRTFEMENEVYRELKLFASARGKTTEFGEISSILSRFNAFPAHDDDASKMSAKIAILNDGLKKLGYADIPLRYQEGANRYDEAQAAVNRERNLGKLIPNKYVGTILPRGTAPLPK